MGGWSGRVGGWGCGPGEAGWVAGRVAAGGVAGRVGSLGQGDISRFSPQIDRIFPGEALNQFFGALDEGFLDFVLDNCILDFDAEPVYLKLQVTNLKNNEVTVNPKTQTLRKIWFFKNPIP